MNKDLPYRVVVRSHKHIYGLIPAQIERIQKDLTFDNPKYARIKQFSQWGSTREPQYLEYFGYDPHKNCLSVPVGYKLPAYIDSHSTFEDRRVYEKIPFPEMVLDLRDTQSQAVARFIQANCMKRSINGCIQMPTGKGKSIVALEIARILGARTLIVVHKTDLVNGWLRDIQKAFDGRAEVGVYQSKSRSVGYHFTVATIQTLNRLSSGELTFLYSTFSFVVQDEMHHCPSNMFSMVDNFRPRYRLGLTATPERNDGLGHIMNLYFGGFAFTYDHVAGDEDILPVKVITRNCDTYFEPVVRTRDGEHYELSRPIQDAIHCIYDLELKRGESVISDIPYSRRPRVQHQSIDGIIVNHSRTVSFICNDIMREYENGHSCIAFFSHIDSVEIYAEKLMSMGVPREDIGLYYGPNSKCDKVIEKAESQRKFITLATYSKATEGTNVRQWEVGFFVSSVNNGKDVEQAVGRIRRTSDNPKLAVAVLYDYRYPNCYQLRNHGATRDQRYFKMKFEVVKSPNCNSLKGAAFRRFGRGF